MAGTTVTFPSNGSEASGYQAVPAAGSGPGVVVIQEWWGVNEQIREVCDRFAGEGFTALAPDLYHGTVVPLGEHDEAGQQMFAMDIQQAATDMGGAVDHLLASDVVSSKGVGVVGFCMGGGLALWLATLRPDAVAAAVSFYGIIPWSEAQPDYSKLAAPVQGHYAANDDFASPDAVHALEEQLRGLGKSVEFFTYPNTDHAFANQRRPEVFHSEHADTAWRRTVEFFRAHVR
jgi:carboxymethylenebutenolidase